MGASKPVRVQGAFVSDGEIDELVEYIKEQRRPQYNEAVEAAQQEAAHDGGKDDFFEDELMDKAIMMVMETQQASVSLLQRRYRIDHACRPRKTDTKTALQQGYGSLLSFHNHHNGLVHKLVFKEVVFTVVV